jgi:cytochrome P450
MGSKTFTNSIEGFNLIYGTSAKHGGVFPKSTWYTRMSRLPDLFTDLDVHRHARARKLIGPTFNLRNVNSCEATINSHIDKLVDALQASRGDCVEFGHLVHCYITDLMFDINIGKQTGCLAIGMNGVPNEG